MSLNISPNGLLGLVMKIEREMRDGKSLDEILSEYPVSKVSLPHLLTLTREASVVMVDLAKDYGELESKYLALKEQIKSSDTKDDIFNTQDTIELKKELERLKNENEELNKSLQELEEELNKLEASLQLYESFFESSPFCSMFYRNFLKKASK